MWAFLSGVSLKAYGYIAIALGVLAVVLLGRRDLRRSVRLETVQNNLNLSEDMRNANATVSRSRGDLVGRMRAGKF